MIVATAGHVDHGKTTLVKALTGIDTDRLAEEKRRGMSIDLGFAHADLGDGVPISFVDVPGHDRFIRNMAAGVAAVDTALLVVAANDGPMPQTHEHVAILEWLGVSRCVVALTKIDRVDGARIDAARSEIAALLAATRFEGAPIVAIAAPVGTGLDVLRAALRAPTGDARSSRVHGRFRFAVDRQFTLAGAGTIVTGTVVAGGIAVGATSTVSPHGASVRVRGIEVHGRAVEAAHAGQRCALNLAGAELKRIAIARGDWIVDPAAHAPTERLDVRLGAARDLERPLRHDSSLQLHHGAAVVGARLALLEGRALEPDASALAQLILDRPIGALHGDRFVIRDQSARRTVGGGVVLDSFPPTRGRRAPARLQLLRSWASATPIRALQTTLDHSPLGVDVRRFALNWNLTHTELAESMQACSAHIVGAHEDRLALSQTAWCDLQQRACDALAAEHTRAPDMVGVGRERLRRIAFPALAQPAYDALIDALLESGRMQQSGMWLHVPDHRVQLTGTQYKLWEKVHPLLEQSAFQPPRVRDLARALLVEEEAMRQLLKRAARIGEVYPVAHDHYFTQRAVQQLAGAVLATSDHQGAVTAAAFRDRIGTGRKLAIQILEFFDRVGFTRRAGDKHMVRQPGLFAHSSTATPVATPM